MTDNAYGNAVFVDDTAFKAFMDPTHGQHGRARSFFLDLDDLERDFVSTSYIVFDTHEWLSNHYGPGPAEAFLGAVEQAMTMGKLSLISGNDQLEREARNLLAGCPQLGLTFAEAVTSVVILAYRINRLFTFNRSFAALAELQPALRLLPSR
ncbi:type II toxin-antitoxin system VapC family toxin [Gorillibacterium sp. sgz500922]|uniref:type II toxin-antitoxin system VapC family toxin n=1 Tax=Gorillibacterium sp. sgz500922 TaxID=3446694 RepID=UPI003F674C1E